MMKEFVRVVFGLIIITPFVMGVLFAILFPFMGIFCPNFLKIDCNTVMLIAMSYSYLFYAVHTGLEGFDAEKVSNFTLEGKVLYTIMCCLLVLSVLIMIANA